jgi:hypothetical protein
MDACPRHLIHREIGRAMFLDDEAGGATSKFSAAICRGAIGKTQFPHRLRGERHSLDEDVR